VGRNRLNISPPRTPECSRRENAFGGTANAHQRVDAGTRNRNRYRGRDIAIGNELDSRTGLSNFVDQLTMPRTIEDDHGQI